MTATAGRAAELTAMSVQRIGSTSVIITHINHASVLIEDGEQFVLTDPWYLSPAFGGWVQNPPPRTDLIQKILSIPPEKLTVIVSHGHDDHLDEFFIARHLARSKFFVPVFNTKGLQYRIASLTGVFPGELTDERITAGNFELRAFINDDFTLYDAIVLISHDDGCVAHTNDNWHSYPDSLVFELQKAISRFPAHSVYFMTQFGIADCFPFNYPGFSVSEATSLVEGRFQSYAKNTTSNLNRLGLNHGYYYANQSVYTYPLKYADVSVSEMAQKYIRDWRLPFRQLVSGVKLGDGIAEHGGVSVPPQDLSRGFFEHCLSFLEFFVQKQIGDDYRLKFLLPHVEHVFESNAVSYQCDRVTWQRIMIGELTLEAIIIGGLGLVHKPNTRNISDLHGKVSKLSYQIQARLKADGVNFFFGNTTGSC